MKFETVWGVQSRPPIKVGDVLRLNNTESLLQVTRTGRGEYQLTNIRDGNRWSEPATYSGDPLCFSEEAISKLLGTMWSPESIVEILRVKDLGNKWIGNP